MYYKFYLINLLTGRHQCSKENFYRAAVFTVQSTTWFHDRNISFQIKIKDLFFVSREENASNGFNATDLKVWKQNKKYAYNMYLSRERFHLPLVTFASSVLYIVQPS